MGLETTPTRAREDGFSLIELIVVMTMLTVALGAILTVVERTTRISNEDRERAQAIRTAQVELDRVVREARQAYRVNPSTGTRLDVSLHRGGITRRVVFECAAPGTPGAPRSCTRREVNPDGSMTTATTVMQRVVNASPFTYTPASGVTDHVTATVEVPASGERISGRNHTIRLSDGFAIRNRGLVP